jgi:hypothetical protein
MYRLQREQEGQKKLTTDSERLEALEYYRETTHKQDGDMNAMLRQKNRLRKRQEGKLMANSRMRGLAIPLLDVNEDDHRMAKSIKLGGGDAKAVLLETSKFNAIATQSIFNSTHPQKGRKQGAATTGSSSSSSAMRQQNKHSSSNNNNNAAAAAAAAKSTHRNKRALVECEAAPPRTRKQGRSAAPATSTGAGEPLSGTHSCRINEVTSNASPTTSAAVAPSSSAAQSVLGLLQDY